MKEEFGKVLWIGGALVVALGLSTVISSWVPFTNEEAHTVFQRGLMIIFAMLVFSLILRERLLKAGALEKFLVYGAVPLAGIATAAFGLTMEFAPHLIQ